jgi:hypothetical protein
MPDPDFHALCAELVAALDPKVVGKDGYGPIAALLPSARAALAQPEPVAPTDEELDELKDDYWWLDANHSKPWIPFARTVLERYGNHTREEI